MKPYAIGFIGGGNMAEAIINAGLVSGIIDEAEVIIADPTPQRREMFEALGIKTTDENLDVIKQARQVVLAVKPQIAVELNDVMQEIDPDKQVVISIMAGWSCDKIAALCGSDAQHMRIVRVMPNTPLLANAGMSAITKGPGARETDEALIQKILASAGEIVTVKEDQMHAVTATSGSGPAYVFLLAEAMAAASQALGMEEDKALLLAKQTIFGAGKLMMESEDTPEELRAKVTSKNGTTHAGIESMKDAGFLEIVLQGMKQAEIRSRELGE